MKKYTVGLIRVLTIQDEELLNLHGKLIEKAFPELKVISRCIEDQPKGIYDEKTEEEAKPKILRLAKEFENEGVDAIIISCAADPAVEEARKLVSVPVIGAGSSASALALAYARKIGVLNLTEETPRVIKEVLGDKLIAEDHPEGVSNTLDLMTDWGRKEAINAARRLKEKGVEAIVLGCTGMSTIMIAPILEKEVGIPVIDPVIAAGAVTLHALRRLDVWGDVR
ncbi:aspartate/glutamate racemase family protein [Thermococcus sibiricus]|uniref:Hydantoin racemase n=1 Tax=Thermococcus sibiricus (strain DSM 12597 / MM 739) TaxID=604354 RepID=C6A1Y1_THESM|nr:AroM family protein [Thermococcus sibiricus]ACS89626.1 hydantoin racemase [Thermococcus sibiricus MM 739]